MLTLQFGQCGNQLGQEFFTKIAGDIESNNTGQSYENNYEYSETICERWFSDIAKDKRRIARAILIDTEKKVLNKIRAKEETNSRWRYSRKNQICDSHGEGSGNNWAYGYSVKAGQLEMEIMETVRKECERADRLDGFLELLSSAGGTGSGVGSRITESLRDEFPTKTILGCLILPFAKGEVGTQNYNGLLTLSKFSDLSDAIVVLENDQLFRICRNPSANQRNQEPLFLQDMNEVATEKLLSIFQPIKNVRNEANFFASKMAAHPGYKMTTIKCTPPLRFSTVQTGPRVPVGTYDSGYLRWQFHIKQLRYTLRKFDASTNFEVISQANPPSVRSSESSHHVYRRSIANLLVTRGASTKIDDSVRGSEELSDEELYVPWTSKTKRFFHFHENRKFLNRDKFVSLVTNNSQVVESLDWTVGKAWDCYTHAAFLHRYKEYGLEDDDFLRAFAKLENVIKNYRELDECK